MTDYALTLSVLPRGRSAASNFVELYKHVKQGIGYQKMKRGIGSRDSGIGVEEDSNYMK